MEEDEADRQIDRQPGQIEEGDRPGAGKEGAQRIEVAQGLQAVAAVAGLERQADQRLVDPAAQRLVETRADAPR